MGIGIAFKMVECYYCKGECTIKYKGLKHPVWKKMTNIDMYECKKCESLITYPMPSKEKLIECYAEYIHGFPENKSAAKEKSNQIMWYKNVVKLLNTNFKNKKIADIGAGEGFFSEELLEISENSSIDCFDFHDIPNNLKNKHTGSNKVEWFKTDVTEKNWIKKEEYDIVVCNAVIEHVTNPEVLVDNLYEIGKKGSEIYIMAPCVDAIAYKVLGKKWLYIIPGEHLTIPSMRGLKTMARRYPSSRNLLKKISPTYSLKYIVDSLFKINLPKILDFSVNVPTGSFFWKLEKPLK